MKVIKRVNITNCKLQNIDCFENKVIYVANKMVLRPNRENIKQNKY